MDRELFQESTMKCAICRNGTTHAGYTTIILEKEQTLLIVKHVPAQICENCGEEYVSSDVNRTLLHHAQEEYERGVALELLNYAA